MSSPIKILFVSAEVAPFSKAGGLGDVAGSLPAVIRKMGYDIRVITPRYFFINPANLEIVTDFNLTIGRRNYNFEIFRTNSYNQTPVYFVDNDLFFGSRGGVYGFSDDALRFYAFQKAVIEALSKIDWRPDLIHINDWHTALIPSLLREKKLKIPTVLTIHNLAFQGGFSAKALRRFGKDNGRKKIKEDALFLQSINFLKRGIINATKITTVSPTYRDEVLTPKFGSGLDRILQKRKRDFLGILNGIDYFIFDPLTDPNVFVAFDENHLEKRTENKIRLQEFFGLPINPNVPILGVVSRFTSQKGLGLFLAILDFLLVLDLQVVIVGEGDEEYTKALRDFVKKQPQKVGAHLKFDVGIASKIYAGSDIFLMPSRFEPCGLGQLIAMRYGAVPIVHKTGGLAYTIKDYDRRKKTGNGFVFKFFSPLAFFAAIIQALELYRNREAWQALVKKNMKLRFSWDDSAREYLKVYKKLIR